MPAILKPKVLLITPPFTQLNTPYPATIFLKGFLNAINVQSLQADLGIETILELFSVKGLTTVFEQITQSKKNLSVYAKRIINLKDAYIQTIEPTIAFLQNKKPTLANLISTRNYLPETKRFEQLDDLEWAFGTMGQHDKAKYLATLYLEDLGDLITEAIDPHFGFSRYAEHLGRYANEFDELESELNRQNSLIDNLLIGLLDNKLRDLSPNLVAVSVPFPGNLYCAFKCAQWIKKNYPHIKLAMGGGFVNTELRSLNDSRVFNYFDYICLDDGELPLQCLLEHLEGKREIGFLKRTFALNEGKVHYFNGAQEKDYSPERTGIPDYSDLLLDKYLSFIEIANPMHSLWSNGRWNKLMLAHGCYWAKCSFCDTTLDYIKHYEPSKIKGLVDRIERIIEQTGENGFHFVDEAAPPVLLRELALEILRRRLTVVWWTNIRFENNFTYDLCRLLAASGCIAVSGGLEVASDRLLKLINKGVDIEQVAKATGNFTKSGIMVHAYLMYGFPTQTEQETIDSLEVVRQIFESGIVQSGFWHRFALTIHSAITHNPDNYKIKIDNTKSGRFANNDLDYNELNKANPEKFAEGLRISLYNYMHGVGFELSLQHWFNFKIPKTTIKPGFIGEILDRYDNPLTDKGKRLLWLGNIPEIIIYTKLKKGKEIKMCELHFINKDKAFNLQSEKKTGEWLAAFIRKIAINETESINIHEMDEDFKNQVGEGFQLFLHGKNLSILRENGLLIL